MKDGAVRLGHHLRQNAEAAAMRHADDDLAHAERAAALDDLLQRRDHGFGAIEAEALGPGEFHVAEFFEALGFDQLVEDGALALAGKRDLLVRSLDALLDPAFLRGIGNVEEFDAKRLTIGPAQNGDDLAYGAKFEPEHMVEKNRAVEVGLAEAVSARVELLLVLWRFEAERIEIGMEMAARPIGADEHQRPDRIAGGALDLGRGNVHTTDLRLCLQLAADRRGRLLPTGIERPGEFIGGKRRPIGPLPRWPLRIALHVRALVFEALKERLPRRVECLRVGLIAGIEVFDIVRIAAIEERSAGESGIGVLARHQRPSSDGIKTGKGASAELRLRAGRQDLLC